MRLWWRGEASFGREARLGLAVAERRRRRYGLQRLYGDGKRMSGFALMRRCPLCMTDVVHGR